MEEVITLINSVGFPIFACVYIFKNNKDLIGAINNLAVTLEGINIRLSLIETEILK